MPTKLTPEKIKRLHQLLCGFVYSQSEVISPAVDLDSETCMEFIVQLYSLCHKLESFFMQLDFHHCSSNEQVNSPFVFVLDVEYRIVDFYLEPYFSEKFDFNILIGADFKKNLYTPSLENWTILLTKIINGSCSSLITSLILQTVDERLFPLLVLITRSQNGLIHLNSLPLKYLEPKSSVKPNDSTENDQEQLAQLHTYILEHLNEPLPSLSLLAQMFGVEEHRLKNGFRTYYHTSIYHFYHEQRLLQAQTYILQTNLRLKEIAFLCGFVSYPNFYKSFKKYFGYSPKDVVRPFKE